MYDRIEADSQAIWAAVNQRIRAEVGKYWHDNVDWRLVDDRIRREGQSAIKQLYMPPEQRIEQLGPGQTLYIFGEEELSALGNPESYGIPRDRVMYIELPQSPEKEGSGMHNFFCGTPPSEVLELVT